MSTKESAVLKSERMQSETKFSFAHESAIKGLGTEGGHEVGRMYELDVLAQFQANLNHVEQLTKKLQFVLAEVRYTLK